MNKVERVTAVMQGRPADRPPVSFWYHFGPGQIAGPGAVAAHVEHVETYDLDFLKIMDDNRYPRSQLRNGLIADAADLDHLFPLRGDEDTFGRQLELIGELSKRFAGQLLTATTIFNAWTTLRNMTAPELDAHGPPTLGQTSDSRDANMSRLLREAPDRLARALEVVAESLAHFTRHCLAAGTDGIYLSVRDDWVDTPTNGVGTYDRLVRPGDLRILAGAAEGRFNMLHVCGKALDFARFANYPAQVINWADRSSGPTIAEVASWARPAICAGVDNLDTMPNGAPEDCARQVADAIAQAAGRPIMISPGCTFDPQAVPPGNLHAIRQAVESAATR